MTTPATAGYGLRFDDGNECLSRPQFVRPARGAAGAAAAAALAEGKLIPKGTRVEARWDEGLQEGWEGWYPCRVTKHHQRLYEVAYDDGDSSTRLLPVQVRRPREE